MTTSLGDVSYTQEKFSTLCQEIDTKILLNVELNIKSFQSDLLFDFYNPDLLEILRCIFQNAFEFKEFKILRENVLVPRPFKSSSPFQFNNLREKIPNFALVLGTSRKGKIRNAIIQNIPGRNFEKIIPTTSYPELLNYLLQGAFAIKYASQLVGKFGSIDIKDLVVLSYKNSKVFFIKYGDFYVKSSGILTIFPSPLEEVTSFQNLYRFVNQVALHYQNLSFSREKGEVVKIVSWFDRFRSDITPNPTIEADPNAIVDLFLEFLSLEAGKAKVLFKKQEIPHKAIILESQPASLEFLLNKLGLGELDKYLFQDFKHAEDILLKFSGKREEKEIIKSFRHQLPEAEKKQFKSLREDKEYLVETFRNINPVQYLTPFTLQDFYEDTRNLSTAVITFKNFRLRIISTRRVLKKLSGNQRELRRIATWSPLRDPHGTWSTGQVEKFNQVYLDTLLLGLRLELLNLTPEADLGLNSIMTDLRLLLDPKLQ
jgi:hypothetical protein